MTNQIKCPGCGWTLEYDPALKKFCCIFCCSAYTVDELRNMRGEEPVNAAPLGAPAGETAGHARTDSPAAAAAGALPVGNTNRDRLAMPEEGIRKVRGTIPMNVLTCRSCGAELMMNHVEASSFCAYCGQATIASERIEDWLEPDTIIPFEVTKDEAERIIRDRLNEGYFIPEGIKNFKTDRLRGIYIPYWLFDIYCADTQGWYYKSGKYSYYAYRAADCKLQNFTTEASVRFNDEYSVKLEPFDTSKKVPFHEAYLSGFYSDRFDVNDEEAENLARLRAVKLFDDEVKATVPGSNKKLEYTELKPEILHEEYSMLPVWFMTFRYEDNPYTILVNGQTRKMVGAVPYVKRKAIATFVALAAIFSPILAVAFSYANYFMIQILLHGGEDSGKPLGYYIAFIVVLFSWTWVAAIRKYRHMKQCIGLTCSTSTNRFVKERTDR